jgi:uncharacterized membrane protein YfcA
MKNIILGVFLILFGLYFFINIKKETKQFKDRDPMGKVSHLKGYTAVILSILGGIITILREIYK